MKPLLIHVDDIDTAAQPWEADLARADVDEMLTGDHPGEFKASGGAQVHAKLTKMGKKVLVQASFAVPLAGQCKRCLKDVTLAEPVEFTLTFVPAESHVDKRKPVVAADSPEKAEKQAEKHARRRRPDDDSPDGSFDAETADEEPYSGKTIDLWEALREEVLLAAPPSPLCREECKGLCPQCGQDLNERDCGHRVQNIDPRWEALKGIQLQSKQSSS